MVEARVLYEGGACTVWRKLVYCMVEVRVLYGGCSCSVWRRLVFCMAEARVLYAYGSEGGSLLYGGGSRRPGIPSHDPPSNSVDLGVLGP